MKTVECPNCGAQMLASAPCPVCEMPHDFGLGEARKAATSTPSPEVPSSPQGFAAREWHSGRMPVALAAVFFLVGTFVPMIMVQRRPDLIADYRAIGRASPRVGASVWTMATQAGPYSRELKSMIAFVTPATAVVLLSFLLSRRHGSVMVASRPLVVVLAIMPIIAAVLPILRIARLNRLTYSPGPGLVLLATGVVLALIGGVTFGRGVPDPPRRSRHDEDDE